MTIEVVPAAELELPQWQCHKVVSAAKILDASVNVRGPHLLLDLGQGDRRTVTVPVEFFERVPAGKFVSGGYYVRYADGYESWSPAKAFEEGYSRMAPSRPVDGSPGDTRPRPWRRHRETGTMHLETCATIRETHPELLEPIATLDGWATWTLCGVCLPDVIAQREERLKSRRSP